MNHRFFAFCLSWINFTNSRNKDSQAFHILYSLGEKAKDRTSFCGKNARLVAGRPGVKPWTWWPCLTSVCLLSWFYTWVRSKPSLVLICSSQALRLLGNWRPRGHIRSDSGSPGMTTWEFLRNAHLGPCPEPHWISNLWFGKQVLQVILTYTTQYENHWIRPKPHLRNSQFQTQGKLNQSKLYHWVQFVSYTLLFLGYVTEGISSILWKSWKERATEIKCRAILATNNQGQFYPLIQKVGILNFYFSKAIY